MAPSSHPTTRALHTWRDRGVDAPQRHTARHALEQLTQRGLLARDDRDPEHREYHYHHRETQ